MGGVHIGTMGWSYEFWVRNFYPDDISPSEFLVEYSKHFHTVEIDSTFYRIPSKMAVENWHSQTPEDFIFSAKFPRSITHGKGLRINGEKLYIFLRNILYLGNKLGPLLIQFPPQFKPREYQDLKEFLQSLPKRHLYAVEFRNRGWLEDKVYNMLRENGIALVLVDHPWMPSLEEVTSSFTYLRWQGDRRNVKGDRGRVERDRRENLRKWADRLESFLEKSIEVYGYFSKFFSGHPPTDAKQLLEHLS